jgi:hypothetical protein
LNLKVISKTELTDLLKNPLIFKGVRRSEWSYYSQKSAKETEKGLSLNKKPMDLDLD